MILDCKYLTGWLENSEKKLKNCFYLFATKKMFSHSVPSISKICIMHSNFGAAKANLCRIICYLSGSNQDYHSQDI